MDASPGIIVSPTRTAMTVGAIVAVLILTVPALPGLNQWAQFVGFAVFIGGIYYGMRLFRKEAGGYITFSKVVIAGIQTAFFTSVILGFAVFVAAKVIDPSIQGMYLDAAEQLLQSADLPSASAAESMKQMREMMSPAFLALVVMFSCSFYGAIAACILGFFLKKSHQI